MGPLSAHTVAAPAGELLHAVDPAGALAWIRDGEGLVGWGEAARVPILGGRDGHARAGRHLAELFADAGVTDEVGLPGTGPVAFGALTFDIARAGSALVVPRVVVGRRGDRTWRTTITPRDGASEPGEAVGAGAAGSADAVGADAGAPAVAGGPAGTPQAATGRATSQASDTDRVRYAGSSLAEVDWLDAVAAAVERLRDTTLEKVVLARDEHVWSKTPFDPAVLLRRLASRFPSCYVFACDGLIGATPELLVRREGDRVESLVLAGSAPRGKDADEDAALGEALASSSKQRREHAPSVRSVRQALSSRCTALTATEPELLRLENIQHLATAVSATLADGSTALELAEELHPTAAVCGAPTPEALGCIRELEGLDRARYSGPIGWVDADGDGEWGIALRCAELSGSRARLFAGAGIVEGSLPEDELEETRLKLRAMESAFER